MKCINMIKEFFSTIKFCLSLSRKSSKLYTYSRIFVNVVNPILTIVASYITKKIIDLLTMSMTGTVETNVIVKYVALDLCISTFAIVSRRYTQYCESLHMEIIDKYLTENIMQKGIGADIELYDNPKYYDKLVSIKRDSNALVMILWNTIDFISAMVSFVVAFSILFKVNILYGIVVILASIPTAIVNQKYTKSLYHLDLSQIIDERQKNYIFQITTTKVYSQDVRLHNSGKMLINKYMAIWDKVFNNKKKMIKSRSILSCIMSLIPEISVTFITFNIAVNIVHGRGTVGDYSYYGGIIGSLYSSVTVVIDTIMRIYENRLKINNIKTFDQFATKIINNGKINLEKINKIELKDVCFTYPNTDKMVLKHISFKLQDGEKIAIVGLNGSGKSTLIKVLLRFYDIDSGKILINDKDIKEYDLVSLRKCFSIYFQNATNYSFTIKDNLVIANNNVEDDERIKNSLDKSDILSKVEQLDKKADTYVGKMFDENGMEFSIGQQQKIAIARTFYRESNVMILDEPSSSLDPEAEKRIFDSINEICNGKLTLFTSHRLTNTSLADRIIVLENGEVIEEGTQDELIAMGKRYAYLYDCCMERYKGKEAESK